MNILLILKVIAAVATAVTGLLGLVKPKAVFGFTGLLANGPRGISEISAIFGGLFLALGIAPLLLHDKAFTMLGIAYLAIAAARIFSIVADQSYDSSNWISLGIEVLLGIILIWR